MYSIGHSTRSIDELIALLKAHGVTRLADIRTVPKSLRHPQFVREALARSLPAAGIAYRHFPGLGGLRKPRKDSPNAAWRNDSFRGYADYMQTAAFEEALAELMAWAGEGARIPAETEGARTTKNTEDTKEQTHQDPSCVSVVSSVVHSASAAAPLASGHTAIMCAEAVWWRCHRQLVADALVARGIPVRHITSAASAPLHELTPFARVASAGRVSYPGLV